MYRLNKELLVKYSAKTGKIVRKVW